MRVAVWLSFPVLFVLAAACIEIETQREIDVTPGAVPEEIEGARWPSLPVSYCIVPDEDGFVDGDRFAELVDEAFVRWGADVRSEGECDEVVQGNERNEIGWGQPDEAMDSPHGGAYQAGFTRLLYRPVQESAQADIIEADILIAPTPPDGFQSEECLFTTILHETGHFLGLQHLESPAVMAPVATDCPQELTDMDRQALAELYGDEVEAP